MFRRIPGAMLLIAVATTLAGCESGLQKATGYFLKQRMLEICKEDKACLAAVDEQYASCEARHAREWLAYLHAGPAREDALLSDYMSKLFSCVVDKDGDAYFAYKPD